MHIAGRGCSAGLNLTEERAHPLKRAKGTADVTIMIIRRPATVVASALLALLGTSLATEGSSAAVAHVSSSVQTAQQLITAAVRAAESEKAFDTISTGVSGNNRAEIQTDSGLSGGLQLINERLHGQTDAVSIILIGRTVYVKGNVPGLHGFMSLTAAAAQHEAGKWIRVTLGVTTPTSERNFWQAAGDALTVATSAPEIELSGQLSLGPNVTVRGQAARQVRGTITNNGQVAREVLYVRANGLALPIEETATGQGQQETLVYSGWGVPPVLHAPATAVPLAVSWLGTYWS